VIVVISGTMDLVLDGDDAVYLRASDSVIQRSTMHSWRNHGSELCVARHAANAVPGTAASARPIGRAAMCRPHVARSGATAGVILDAWVDLRLLGRYQECYCLELDRGHGRAESLTPQGGNIDRLRQRTVLGNLRHSLPHDRRGGDTERGTT
jgi:hypothetical protein